MRELE
jgi:predicted RNase H-like nuclease (RuvC/YqgF family)